LKKKLTILSLAIAASFSLPASAQKENGAIRKGNLYYKEKQIDLSKKEYQKAVELAPQNPVAQYNLGNAEFRKDEYEDAEKSYDESIHHSDDKAATEKGMYNKGVAQIKQKKLEESIASWKDALKRDPEDVEARENLQKALMELKMKQPPQPEKQKDQKKQQQQQKEQPKPQASKLSKQQVDQYLKNLEQREKDVQDRMNQNKTKSLSQPDKDW
jgi:tetratricopeptide (TPR) repeat protein